MSQSSKYDHEVEPLATYQEYPADEMCERARWFYRDIARRRSVREFDTRVIPGEVIEQCLLAAGTAPSGANQQPWHFAVITDPEKKRQIRLAAEAEEREFYEHRAPEEWLDALAPLGTDASKPFLEEAPALIAIVAILALTGYLIFRSVSRIPSAAVEQIPPGAPAVPI